MPLFWLLLHLAAAQANVQITEFMADNESTLADEDGDFEDWIELHNPTPSSTTLNGLYLTDDPDNLTKWAFPSVMLEADAYLIVFASDKERLGDPFLHTNFKLGASGEYLALTNGASVVSQFDPVEQFADVSYGIDRNGALGYFSTPTPGKANLVQDGGSGTLAPAKATSPVLTPAPFKAPVTTPAPLKAPTTTLTPTKAPVTALAPTVVPLLISEFLASNTNGLEDEDGDSSDWIELYNSSPTAMLNLSNCFLTDDNEDLTKWGFPANTVLEAGAYLVVFASNKDRTGSPLHTNFRLAASGEYLAVTDGTSIVFEYRPEYPSQTSDRSYGVDVNGDVGYFASPSPGEANPVRDPPVADPAEPSDERGFYDRPFDVTLSTATSDAQIYFTTNGGTPTESDGTLYTGAITISTTTIMRTRTYKAGFLPSKICTHSYLFIVDVLQQPQELDGFPNGLWRDTATLLFGIDPVLGVPLDMEMDPEIVSKYSPEIESGMLDIPTISLTGDLDDFFGDGQGFYLGFGEKEVSVEVLYSGDEAKDNEQINAGAEQTAKDNLKASIRLNFRSEYGNREWNTDLLKKSPLNSDSVTDSFRTLNMRAGYNRSWARSSRPDASGYEVDQFVRDTQIAVSGLGSHGIFTHVYLNGAYWGLYNVVERPDDHFMASYFPGDEDDWFFTNHNLLNMDTPAAGRLHYLVDTLVYKDMRNPENYLEFQEYVDIDNFIEYMIVSFWAGVTDWPQNNFYIGYRKETSSRGPTPAQFFVWDAEFSFELRNDYLPQDGANIAKEFIVNTGSKEWIHKIWHAAFANVDFRMAFVVRVDELTADGAPLSKSAASARFDTLSSYIESAVIGESARWGDSLSKIGLGLAGLLFPTFERDEHWRNTASTIRRLLETNTEKFIQRLTDANMYGPTTRETENWAFYKCAGEPMCYVFDGPWLVPSLWGNQVKVELFGFCYSWCSAAAFLVDVLFTCGTCEN